MPIASFLGEMQITSVVGCRRVPSQRQGWDMTTNRFPIHSAISLLLALGGLLSAVWPESSWAADSFVAFESGHVRPLALSPSGKFLFAVNSPDNRLEVFRVQKSGLSSIGEVVVGLEPVAVAARTDSEVYVVNHLSDSVSVVDASDPSQPFVRETLLVGDEPRDVVIAGRQRDKIFITTAHRGQNYPRDPQLTTPSVGRGDVWVFAADDLSHDPHILTLFCDTPRALAVNSDGTRVYAAAFHSGNQTSVLTATATIPKQPVNEAIADGFVGLGPPPPVQSEAGVPAPIVGVMVKFDQATRQWRDAAGRDWSARMRFNLPDKDVFVLDATQDPPVELASISGVGTILFNLAVNPANGKVYVSNLESQNHVRFEPVLNGRIALNRVTIIDKLEATPVHLNPHIDYTTPSGPQDEINDSLALPLQMAFAGDGKTLYITAFGSQTVAVLDENASVVDRIVVGGGPSGLALDEARKQLYVMNRFDHTISIVDTDAGRETGAVALRYNPEPKAVRLGRPVLYNAAYSGHGDAACASCHIFGNMDDLAWDLGDPGGEVLRNPVNRVEVQKRQGRMKSFHPMKGPMTTQSFRGLDGAGPMHWRGDRNGVNAGAENPDPNDERQAFMHFRGAFQTLLGMEEELPISEMEKFRDFVLRIKYPPNPIINIDGTLTKLQAAGKEIFGSDGLRDALGGDGNKCASCHTLPLGTDGHGSFELEPQEFKVPHLRNLYQKVGMFGFPIPNIVKEPGILSVGPTAHLGDQIRGTGFLHDGSMPTLFNFFRVAFDFDRRGTAAPFTFPDAPGRSGDQKVRELVSFLFAFDTGLAPAVGQQVTLDAKNLSERTARYLTLRQRAEAGDCDLVFHGRVGGTNRSGLYLQGTTYQSDRGQQHFSEQDLVAALADGGVVTVSAVPVGSGKRIAIDRDEDGQLDLDEVEAGSDPANTAPTRVSFP